MPSGSETTTAGDTADARPAVPRPDGDSPPPAVAEARPGRPSGRRPGQLRRLADGTRRHWRSGLAAAVAGLALVAAFPPYDIWPLSLVSVAALSALTRGRTARQGAWLGFALGLPFFIGLLKWLSVIGWDAVVGLSLAEALFFVPLGAGLAVTSRLRGWPLWAACLWVAQEWARDRVPFGGFPWGRLAFANTDTPFTPLAALGGAPLVTFAVALTGALLAWAALRSAAALPRVAGREAPAGREGRSAAGALLPAAGALLPAAGAVGLAAVVTAAGYAVPVPTGADSPGDVVSIAVVQGNVQQPGMDFLGRPMMILNNHVDATLELAEDIDADRVERPDIVIWPENSSDLDPFHDDEARAAIERAVSAVGVPILVGAVVDHPTKEGYVENQGIVWDPETGPGDAYTKQHPVPFGEYVPFREQLGKVISRLERVPRDFSPGERTGVLDIGPARLGDVICFEVAYDGIMRDTVNDGARALIVQTNNATYGRTGQPEQQLAMSRLRAVEHGRAVVTAATSGISAVVAPDGEIEQRTEEFTRDVLIADLPLRDGRTVADRVGAAPEWSLAGLGLLAWAGIAVRGRLARRRGPVESGGREERAERGEATA
ncbi:apolipoprotein N-acyltransferase [Streptomyces sp. NBC_01803]|uniref:apolipoprotein N-acyltransferase n=1 Tax=Streptomyces sp. NBC_01803 TaxID=2975946 RepID=UPI002DDB18AB|nr:apolipoprotein N-acyltransferase [Streptomyces sp. NBC_01803]WSA47213.1 apolipoprotein N-acyltransferase [Streptomyces sp. NBC_01803]